MTRSLALATLLATVAIGARAASAAVVNAGPTDDVEAIINGLQPGDELVLADGMYSLSGRFGIVVTGTATDPIVIRADDGATPHFHRPDASQNIWDIQASYVELRGLEFSGGSAGLRFESGSFVTIRDCEIHDTADVAVRMNDGGQLYESMHIVGNEIHHTNGTGEGMYLGCNSNGCQLANALIERNYVHHTNQAGVSQGDGIEIKEGSYGNVVRDNVIHDTKYPCILTYSAAGNGAANVLERNVLWNCGDHAIQSAADATIRNNIILGAGADGIAMQPHQAGTPSNLTVAHNTILAPANHAVSLRGTTGSVVIANNALYAQAGNAIYVNGGDTSGVTLAGNIGAGGVAGLGGGYADGNLAADFAGADYSGAPPIDVFPAAGSALIGAGDATHVPADDFNGTARGGVADVGAYRYASGGNPGWTIGEGFKDEVTQPPAADAGPGGGADGGELGDDGGAGSGGDGGAGNSGDGDAQGGCGCTVDGRGRGSGLAVLGLALLAVLAVRRRR